MTNLQFEFLDEIGPEHGFFHEPYGVASIDGDTIYVSDHRLGYIQKFDANGNSISKLGDFGFYGAADGQLRKPAGLAVDSRNNLLVANSGNNQIVVFDEEGNIQEVFGIYGQQPGELDRPYGVSVSAKGNVCVADTGNGRVQVFDRNYNFLHSFAATKGVTVLPLISPVSVRVVRLDGKELLLICDTGQGRALLTDIEGEFVSEFRPGLIEPTDAILLATGQICVTDADTHTFHFFEVDGTPVNVFGGLGSGLSQFVAPRCLALKNDVEFLITDFGNSRVQTVDVNGSPLGTFCGSSTPPENHFRRPTRVKANTDRILVSDTDNFRIQIFDFNWGFVSSFVPGGTPVDLDFEPNTSNVYVLNDQWTVHKIDSDSGAWLQSFSVLTALTASGLGTGIQPRSCVVDRDGNLFFGGQTFGAGGGTPNGVLVKTDANGNLLNQFGSPASTPPSPFADYIFDFPTDISMDENRQRLFVLGSHTQLLRRVSEYLMDGSFIFHYNNYPISSKPVCSSTFKDSLLSASSRGLFTLRDFGTTRIRGSWMQGQNSGESGSFCEISDIELVFDRGNDKLFLFVTDPITSKVLRYNVPLENNI